MELPFLNLKIHFVAFGFGGWITVNERYVRYTGMWGRGFRVRIKEVEAITVEEAGWGYGSLKLIGKGTDLARTKLPMSIAHSVQDWLILELKIGE